MKVYFTVVVMLANFHYGTLNYFVGQFLFSVLAALRVYGTYARTRARPLTREEYEEAHLAA
jgi:hypothetical protein